MTTKSALGERERIFLIEGHRYSAEVWRYLTLDAGQNEYYAAEIEIRERGPTDPAVLSTFDPKGVFEISSLLLAAGERISEHQLEYEIHV